MGASNKKDGENPRRLLVIGIIGLLLPILLAIGTYGINDSPIQIHLPTPINKTAVAGITDAQKLEQIDSILKQALSGSIAYNVPDTITLNETATIELLLNPSLSPYELAKEVAESGQVETSIISISPRMKAELITQDDGLEVKALEGDSEQLISGTDTTSWTWYVTAKEGGSHALTLVVYRLINFDGKEDWRKVETYTADINVEVTLGQRIMMLDWKWFAGIVLSLLAIPAFWRWVDGRKKKKVTKKK